jgi:glutamate formiminotransferase/formiminotetrahydrofolate cyclodeaminase
MLEMRQLVECVPNFSEGRDPSVIAEITGAIEAVAGVTLLDVDPGRDTNRTVVTFVGAPEAVAEAAFQGVAKAARVIDMGKHEGAHPRMGACDVCPFIPIEGMGVDDTVALAEQVAGRVARELDIPVYLYGKAARTPERERLPDIRKGEYEGLRAKLQDPAFAPDFGEAVFNARSGATVVGVRDFLLAYNVNLATRDLGLAREIGRVIREKGYKQRDENGKLARDEDGKVIKVPGRLSKCQAGGWYIEEYGQAQVTMNLTDFHVTGLHTAFEAVSEEAAKRGVRVTGSEVVGMVPRAALVDAGRFYLTRAGQNTGVPEAEIVHHAVLGLGLNDIGRFDPQDKVIEYAIERGAEGFREMTLSSFLDLLSSDAPAPGGGSVAALSGGLSAALSAMVASLTVHSKQHRADARTMETIANRAQSLKARSLALLEMDAKAFEGFMRARRMPKKKGSDRALREAAMDAAGREMTLVPMETLRVAGELIHLAEAAVKKGMGAAVTDATVAALQANAAAAGAYLNVLVNLPEVKDAAFVAEMSEEAATLVAEVESGAGALLKTTVQRLAGASHGKS